MSTATATRIRSKEREDLAQELRRRVTGEVRFDAYSRVLPAAPSRSAQARAELVSRTIVTLSSPKTTITSPKMSF